MLHHPTPYEALLAAEITTILGVLEPPPDHRLRYLVGRYTNPTWTATELGCWTGAHSCELARHYATITSVDVRPQNLARAMLRANLLGIRNINFKLAHVDHLDQITTDILVHIGVLYHLYDPINHLQRLLRTTTAKVLCLDTHINYPKLDQQTLVHHGCTYRYGVYKEFGWGDELSGVEPLSKWLELEDLLKIVREANFVVRSVEPMEYNVGPRVTIVADRLGP